MAYNETNLKGEIESLKQQLEQLGQVATTGLAPITAALAALSQEFAKVQAASLAFGGQMTSTLPGTSMMFSSMNTTVREVTVAVQGLSVSAAGAAETLNTGMYTSISTGTTITQSAAAALTSMAQSTATAGNAAISSSAGFTQLETGTKAAANSFTQLEKGANTAAGSASSMESSYSAAWSNMEKSTKSMSVSMESSLTELGTSSEESMDTMAEGVSSGVSTMNSVLSESSVSYSMEQIEESFSQGAVAVKESAPEMAEGAKEAAEGVSDSLAQEAPNVFEAAANLAVGLSEAFLDQDTAQKVASLAETIQGTLSESLNSTTPVVSTFTGVLSDVLQAAGTTSPALQTVASAVETAGKAYTLTSEAVSAFSAVKKVLNTYEAAGQLTTMATNGALTAQQMIVGLATGQISLMTVAKGLATKAQMAWNAAMMANPIGLVIAAVAALAVGIGVLVAKTKEQTQEDQLANAALEEKRAQLEETRQKYEEARQAQMEQTQADITQADRVQQLADELRTLADESGNVAEKDQSRAQFILGELNGALDTEYSMVDGVIQKYGELSDSIDQLIQKKKAQILLDAQEQSYREALTAAENQAKVVSADYLRVMNQREKVEEAQLARDKKLAETKKYLEEGTWAFNLAMAESEENLKNEQEKLDSLTATYQTSTRELQKWNDEISNYETASGLIQTGQFEEGIQLLSRYSESLMTVTEAAEEFGGDQQKINEAMTGQAETAVAGYIAAYDAYEKEASETNRLWLEQAETQAKNAITEYEKIGENSGQGLINGLLSKQDDLVDAATIMANLMPDTMGDEMEVNSPSKVTEELGGYVAEGLAVGIRNNDSAQQAAAGQARAILESYQLTLSQEQKDAIRATEAVAEDIQKAFDQAWGQVEEDYDLGLISEAEMYQELGRLRDMYFAEGTREHLKYTRQIADYYARSAKEQMESELEDLKFKLDMGWITEEEYYAQLAALRDEYLAYGSEEWKKYTLQIDQYNKKVAAAAEQALQEQKDNILTLFQETAQEAGKAIDEIESRMDQMKQSLDTGSIYEEITTTIKGGSLNKVWKDGEWVNDDITISRVSFAPLEEQVRLLEQYETVLSQLKERGMNEAIFEQFVGYSAEEGVKVGNAMLEMTDEEYSRIEHMLSRRGQLAGEISERMYAGQMEEAAQGMRQALQEEFLSQVPEEFLDGGRLSAEKFGQGFEEKLQELLPGLSQRVQGILSGALQSVVSGGVDSISQVTYNNVYNLNGSKDTVHQQLWEVENFNTIRRHRGIA